MDLSPSKLNAFENYGEFLDAATDSIKSKLKSVNTCPQQDEFANDMLDANDINAIMKQKFFKAEYPTDIMAANIFCPICGKIVM